MFIIFVLSLGYYKLWFYMYTYILYNQYFLSYEMS